MKIAIIIFLSLLIVCSGFVWGIYEYKTTHNLSDEQVFEALGDVWNIIRTRSTKPVAVKVPKLPSAKDEALESSQDTQKETQPKLERPVLAKLPDSSSHLPDSKKADSPKDVSKPVTDRLKEPAIIKPSVLKPALLPEVLVKEIIKEAEVSYAQLDFDGALKKIERFSGKEIPTPYVTQADKLKQKCLTFKELVAEISPKEMTSFEQRVEITLITGIMLEGQLIEETDNSLRIKTGYTERELALGTEVASYRKVTLQEYQAKLRREYEKRRQGLKGNALAQDYYQLALYCYKNRINDGALEMLETAWDKNPALVQIIREDKAKRLYISYQLLVENNLLKSAERVKTKLKEKYPDSKYLGLMQMSPVQSSPGKPSSQPPPSEPSDRPAPVELPVISKTAEPDKSKWSKQIEEAEHHYEEGRVHLEKTFERGPDFKRETERASECFRKALKIYQELESTNPGDRSITTQIEEITRLLIYLRKHRIR